ncbi:MAG TPA: septal ring lytic transglycosylase RlpA family protein, partial [Prosthecobacter sp.]|nr:septal ring lytic transglycosylase RlpA family protein [Prosthecobacter sp.]
MVPRRLFQTLLTVLLASCASQKPAWQEQGYASYVADAYTGRPTSSGQLYHPQAYTAAHHSLPFGTIVTVKNTQTGRVVNVTVNDRFPYYPGRVINLSSIAAQHIGIPYMSMAPVTVTAQSLPPGYGPAPQQHTAWQAPAAPAPQPAWQPQPAPYAAP